jgi:hypothetical protein
VPACRCNTCCTESSACPVGAFAALQDRGRVSAVWQSRRVLVRSLISPWTLSAVHLQCGLSSIPRGVRRSLLGRGGQPPAAVCAAGTGRRRGGRTTTWRACGTTSTSTTTSWPTPRAWCTTSTRGARPVLLQHRTPATCPGVHGNLALRQAAHVPKQGTNSPRLQLPWQNPRRSRIRMSSSICFCRYAVEGFNCLHDRVDDFKQQFPHYFVSMVAPTAIRSAARMSQLIVAVWGNAAAVRITQASFLYRLR